MMADRVAKAALGQCRAKRAGYLQRTCWGWALLRYQDGVSGYDKRGIRELTERC